MAQSATPPPLNSPGFLAWLRELFNRTQKIDEEIEPPRVAGARSRIVMTDENGGRWALTVDTSGTPQTDAL